MGKLISWIVLALFVLVVPFGSWYYLNAGLQYRKAATRDLIKKDSISTSMDTLNVFNGKTTIYIQPGTKVGDSVIYKLTEQFGKVPSFQVIQGDSLPSGYLNSVFSKFKTAQYILLDTSKYIRNSYTADLDGIRKLVEHTAIVLPRFEEADIKMKDSHE